jgi:hypothetical protein
MEGCYIAASWGQTDWLRHLFCFLGGGGVATIVAAAVGLVIIPMTLRENAKRQREQFQEQRDIELARQAFDAREQVQAARRWLREIHEGSQRTLKHAEASDRGEQVAPTEVDHDMSCLVCLSLLVQVLSQGPSSNLVGLPAYLADGLQMIESFGRSELDADPGLVGKKQESVLAHVKYALADLPTLIEKLDRLRKASAVVSKELDAFDQRLYSGSSLITSLERTLRG